MAYNGAILVNIYAKVRNAVVQTKTLLDFVQRNIVSMCFS